MQKSSSAMKTESRAGLSSPQSSTFELVRRRLAQHLRFDPESGQILLFDQRMLLFHGFSFATLRQELVEQVGLDRAREMFTRLGYQQGVADSDRARVLAKGDVALALMHGPPLREMEGFVRNRPIDPLDDSLRFNPEQGQFWGAFHMAYSWEAEAHVQHLGLSGVPACWLTTGYATGYSTALMGRPILWREQECVAMGHLQCRIFGKPLEEWHDATEDLRFFQIENFVSAPHGRSVTIPVVEAPTPLPAPSRSSFGALVGASAAFNAVVHLLRRVADTDATVLFLGESGVGKELFSRTLHAISPRAPKPLVAVNCAAIPADLVEAELFGVEKGAFTGAIASRPGRFERANGGTLFLDEVSSLPLPAQGRLLRVLQEGEIERVGDIRVRKVNVRIVAAANRDLRSEVAAGRFREDLFFRLNVFPIEIPPLRERREDIPLLVNLFLDRYAQRMRKPVRGLTIAASQMLRDYDWPGNVRELENLLERAVILVEPSGMIDVQHLFRGGEVVRTPSFALFDRSASTDEGDRSEPAENVSIDRLIERLLTIAGGFEEIESRILRFALDRSRGNLSAAARLLKLRRGQVEYRLKRYEQVPGLPTAELR